ncbi:hypothetical protein AB0M12_40490 [Nocardia vinacea]|uniref:hypothetical protein n=1 Tax=Nocardia vinacea TaxID=96468 RepID=UPI00341C24C0
MQSEAPTRHPALAVVRGITRIGGHIAREAVTRPSALRAADVPVTGRELTTDLLTAVLCYNHLGAEVEAFATDKTSGSSTRWKLTVGYNEIGRVAGLPENLLAKTTADFEQQLTLDLAGALQGEPGFFKHIRPNVELEAPRCYHSAVDSQSGRSIPLLEDERLAACGASAPDFDAAWSAHRQQRSIHTSFGSRPSVTAPFSPRISPMRPASASSRAPRPPYSTSMPPEPSSGRMKGPEVADAHRQ